MTIQEYLNGGKDKDLLSKFLDKIKRTDIEKEVSQLIEDRK